MTKTGNGSKSAKAFIVKKKSSKSKGTAESRILSALASQYSLGSEAPSKSDIASFADMTSNVSSYKTMCGILKRKGLVGYDKDTMWLTPLGLDKVEPELEAQPKTNEAFQEKIKETIKMKKSREIFDYLCDGQIHSFSEIAKAIGVDENNTSFKTYLTGVTKYTDKSTDADGKKMYCLTDEAFRFGRPSMI